MVEKGCEIVADALLFAAGILVVLGEASLYLAPLLLLGVVWYVVYVEVFWWLYDRQAMAVKCANRRAASLRKLAHQQITTAGEYSAARRTIDKAVSPELRLAFQEVADQDLEFLLAAEVFPAYEILRDLENHRTGLKTSGKLDAFAKMWCTTLTLFLEPQARTPPSLLEQFSVLADLITQQMLLPLVIRSFRRSQPRFPSFLSAIQVFPTVFLLLRIPSGLRDLLDLSKDHGSPFNLLKRASSALSNEMVPTDALSAQLRWLILGDYLRLKQSEALVESAERRSHDAILDAVLDWKNRKNELEMRRFKQD